MYGLVILKGIHDIGLNTPAALFTRITPPEFLHQTRGCWM